MKPRTNWPLVWQIGLVALTSFGITWSVYKLGSPVAISLTAALAPVWIGLPVMLVVAVLSKWWRPDR